MDSARAGALGFQFTGNDPLRSLHIDTVYTMSGKNQEEMSNSAQNYLRIMTNGTA